MATRGEKNRSSTLDKAMEAVMVDRNTDYDDPEDNFKHIADIWNAYLKEPGYIQPHDVANMMIAVKMARSTTSPTKQDHWTDMAGYAACGYSAAVSSDEA